MRAALDPGQIYRCIRSGFRSYAPFLLSLSIFSATTIPLFLCYFNSNFGGKQTSFSPLLGISHMKILSVTLSLCFHQSVHLLFHIVKSAVQIQGIHSDSVATHYAANTRLSHFVSAYKGTPQKCHSVGAASYYFNRTNCPDSGFPKAGQTRS